MNLAFYNAAGGAQQQQYRMNVLGNNIANVNTYGFKAEKPSFAALMYGNIVGIDEEQLPRGAGTRMIMADTDFSSGSYTGTSRPQSYAIDGDGFFALLDPGTGEVSYTRDGTFSLAEYTQLDEEGLPEQVFYLSDGLGHFVLNRVGATIEVTDPNAEQPVGVFDFINKDGMRHIGNNRFQPVEKNGQVQLGTGRVMYGMLEQSNADLSQELAKVIEAQRSFSYALRMVQTSDEVESTINGLRG